MKSATASSAFGCRSRSQATRHPRSCRSSSSARRSALPSSTLYPMACPSRSPPRCSWKHPVMAALAELRPRTRAGARLIEHAEALSERLSALADQHDSEGTYPLGNVALLKEVGYFVAPISEQMGGLGVDSVY